MPQTIRIWQVSDEDTLEVVASSRIKREEQLENWLEKDISMISPDYLVIGRQVTTDFGGIIDLICMDSSGDLVVVELKRGLTPREVTAQALDYASWITDLSHQRITEIATEYLPENNDLESAFREAFGNDLPETLNESHSILIVAESMDSSTERIVKYLHARGIPINVLTVQHFKSSNDTELLAQVFLIEPSDTTERVKTQSKRKQNLSMDQIRTMYDDKGLGQLYESMLDKLDQIFPSKEPTISSLTFKGKIGDGRPRVIFSLIPSNSNADHGLSFQVYSKRLADYSNLSTSKVEELLPTNHSEWTFWAYNRFADDKDNWTGYEGFFKSNAEIDKFVKGLNNSK